MSQSPGDFLESLPHSLEESILLSLSKTICVATDTRHFKPFIHLLNIYWRLPTSKILAS